MITLTRDQARRLAVRAQLLDGSASGVLDAVERLGFLQLDPTSRVARSHLLLLWSRLGDYDRSEVDRLLWEGSALFEWRAYVLPMSDLALYRSRMRRFPFGDGAWARRVRAWLEANSGFRRYVLRELRRRGPLGSRELEDRSVDPWPSTGWTGNRNVAQMLEFLSARGGIAIAGRRGAQRLWDLAERWYPPARAVPAATADRKLAEKRLRALGIARAGPGKPARVEGVDGSWVVHRRLLDVPDEPLPERTTLLSPFDRLIHDRDRAEALFGFRYRLEIYVPRAQRKYGYFVLPVLRGDRLVGRIDPELDRRSRRLVVHAVHPEPGQPFDEEAAREATSKLAAWLGAETVEWPKARARRRRA